MLHLSSIRRQLCEGRSRVAKDSLARRFSAAMIVNASQDIHKQSYLESADFRGSLPERATYQTRQPQSPLASIPVKVQLEPHTRATLGPAGDIETFLIDWSYPWTLRTHQQIA
jgi:hypothetical protein